MGDGGGGDRRFSASDGRWGAVEMVDGCACACWDVDGAAAEAVLESGLRVGTAGGVGGVGGAASVMVMSAIVDWSLSDGIVLCFSIS